MKLEYESNNDNSNNDSYRFVINKILWIRYLL